MRITKQLQALFVFLLVVVSFRFFDARFLDVRFTNYFVFLFILSAIAVSVPYIFPTRIGFVLPVQLIILSMLVSIVMANISWEQSLMDSIIMTVPLMLWFFFFYLLHIKIPVKIIEGIIIIYGIIYILLYFYQLADSQNVLFGKSDEIREERGVFRVIFSGGGIFFLSSFLTLNKLTTQKRGKLLWISLAILGIVIPFLQVTRQFIAGVLVIYVIHLVKDLSFIKKSIIITLLIGALIYVSHSDNEIIKGIIEAQKTTMQAGKEYIRIQSGTYFLTEFSHDNINRVLGNGVPYNDVSNYGIFVQDLKSQGFYLEDVGIIAVYAMFGILAVIGFILIWFRSFQIPLPEEYYYLKYYLWFLLATSLTSDNVYSYDYLISTVFVLYIYHFIYLNYRNLPINSSA